MNINELKVIFEDRDIIVCVKPVGVLSQAASDTAPGISMCDILSDRIGGTSPYIGVVHRLDCGVGGIMVYAKTKSAASSLSAQMNEPNVFKKQYLAAVHGRPDENSGVMRDLLFKDSRLGKSFVVQRSRKGVKEAVLSYEARAYDEISGLSLVLVALQTGRTHQIRVQFSSRGFPLAGDKKYGAKDNIAGIGLWSYSLEFQHPISKVRQSFFALPSANEVPWSIFEKEILSLKK